MVFVSVKKESVKTENGDAAQWDECVCVTSDFVNKSASNEVYNIELNCKNSYLVKEITELKNTSYEVEIAKLKENIKLFGQLDLQYASTQNQNNSKLIID